MRKAYLLLAAVLLLALLVACAPMEAKEKDNVTEKKESTEKETVDEKVVEPKKETTTPTPAPKPKVTAPVPVADKPETKVAMPTNLPEAIQSKIEAANTKLKSVSYISAIPENQGRFLDAYHVMGDKIKVKLYEDNEYVEDGYFDTVYLDTTKKTATGRCENKRRCMSSRVDNTGKAFDNVNYDDYRRKTPYEWLADMTTAEVVGPEIVDKRSALKISYPKGDTTVEMWLDGTYGIPLQLKMVYPNEEEDMYQYSNFQFNTLKEEDVTPAFIEPLDDGNQTD